MKFDAFFDEIKARLAAGKPVTLLADDGGEVNFFTEVFIGWAGHHQADAAQLLAHWIGSAPVDLLRGLVAWGEEVHVPSLPDASLDDDALRAAFLSWAETEEENNREASALLLGKVIGNPASILTVLDIFAHAKAQRMPELPTAWLENDAEAAA